MIENQKVELKDLNDSKLKSEEDLKKDFEKQLNE